MNINIDKELKKRFLLQEEYLGNCKPVNHSNPLVSVTVNTYQHGNYIRECLNGALMQHTNFPYEIIIGEDDSTDGTRNICIEYAEKHPDKIRLFLRNRKLSQLYDQHGNFITRFNGIWTRMSSRGKYIALCEGDDYWTDPLKLQKQFDILEKNPGFSACFTNAILLNEMNNTKRNYVQNLKEGILPKKQVMVSGGGIYPTASLVFKNNSGVLEVFQKIDELAGDNLLIKVLATQGDIYFLNELTCVYRRWAGGVYSKISNDRRALANRSKKTIIGLKKLKMLLTKPFQEYLDIRISTEALFILKVEGVTQNIKQLSNLNIKDLIKILTNRGLNLANVILRFFRFFLSLHKD